jgi:photosystem II stability/assembly factor-like uncharacterized protein
LGANRVLRRSVPVALFICLLIALLPSSAFAASWTPQRSGTTAGLDVVDFVSTSRGWAFGSGTLLGSVDGGSHWSPVGSPRPDLLVVDFLNAKLGLGAGQSAVRTMDGGVTWIPAVSVPQPFGRVQPNGLAFVDATHGWALDFTSGRLFKTVDGGRHWTVGSGGIPGLNAISFIDARQGWAVGELSKIIHIENGGAKLTIQSDPLAGNANAFLHSVKFVDSRNGWAGGSVFVNGVETGVILHTADGGRTWRFQLQGAVGNSMSSISFSDRKHGVAVGGDTTYVTTDGGNRWVPVPSGTSLGVFAVSMMDASHAWAVGPGGTIVKFVP